MPVRACDHCQKFCVVDRDRPEPDPCPFCSRPMRVADTDEVGRFLKGLSDEPPPAPSPPAPENADLP